MSKTDAKRLAFTVLLTTSISVAGMMLWYFSEPACPVSEPDLQASNTLLQIRLVSGLLIGILIGLATDMET